MITAVIDFLTKTEPQWYAMLIAIVQFISRLFGKRH